MTDRILSGLQGQPYLLSGCLTPWQRSYRQDSLWHQGHFPSPVLGPRSPPPRVILIKGQERIPPSQPLPPALQIPSKGTTTSTLQVSAKPAAETDLDREKQGEEGASGSHGVLGPSVRTDMLC